VHFGHEIDYFERLFVLHRSSPGKRRYTNPTRPCGRLTTVNMQGHGTDLHFLWCLLESRLNLHKTINMHTSAVDMCTCVSASQLPSLLSVQANTAAAYVLPTAL
jgi:hypothetical protein